jgi:SET domain-containing protein
MLLVPTELHEINGKGIGLFASVPLPVNTKIYKRCTLFTHYYTKAQIEKLRKTVSADLINSSAIYDAQRGLWRLDVDNMRFINHSEEPNVRFTKSIITAYTTRAIKKGEELVCNYLACNDTFLNFKPHEPTEDKLKKG